MSNRFEAGIIAATTGLTLALGGCAANSVEARQVPTTTQTDKAGEVNSTPEFSPAATGEYAPESVVNKSEGELIELWSSTGNTPEELEEDALRISGSIIESGTTEEELAEFVSGTDASFEDVDNYVEAMQQKYEGIACMATGGYSDPTGCKISSGVSNAHAITLRIYANKRAYGKNLPDFHVGKSELESTKVIEGSFESGKFVLKSKFKRTSNFNDSIAAWLSKGDGADEYGSMNWGGEVETTVTPYERQGDHYISRDE